ncbi:unnamed protein product [Camellia sinensis]
MELQSDQGKENAIVYDIIPNKHHQVGHAMDMAGHFSDTREVDRRSPNCFP